MGFEDNKSELNQADSFRFQVYYSMARISEVVILRNGENYKRPCDAEMVSALKKKKKKASLCLCVLAS